MALIMISCTLPMGNFGPPPLPMPIYVHHCDEYPDTGSWGLPLDRAGSQYLVLDRTKNRVDLSFLWFDTLVSRPYIGITCYPLPQNNDNLPLPFFGGNYPIFIIDNIY